MSLDVFETNENKVRLAERRVIQHILFDFEGRSWASMAPHLDDESFSDPAHKVAFSVIQETAKMEDEVNALTCIPYIPDGWLAYFSALDEDLPPTFRAWRTFLGIVIDAQIARQSSAFGAQLKIAPDPKKTLEEIKNKAEILQLKAQLDGDVSNLNELMLDCIRDIEARCQANQAIGAVTTGVEKLDELFNGGNFGGEVVVIGARPSMGKTTLALDLFLAPWFVQKKGSIFFSMEMSKKSLCRRILSHQSGVELSALITGDYDRIEKRWEQMRRAAGAVSVPQLLIDDSVDHTVESIESTMLKQWKVIGKPATIVIDYLQLLQCSSDSFSRENEVAKISRGLKKIAKKYDIPVVVLAQINRACEKREDGRPMLSDLRESGAIEQDADKIIFINRPFVLGKHDDPEHCELIVAKNRDGRTGIVNVRFDAEKARILG